LCGWKTGVYFGLEDGEFRETIYVIVATSSTLSVFYTSQTSRF
jgi:hypothetical protein